MAVVIIFQSTHIGLLVLRLSIIWLSNKMNGWTLYLDNKQVLFCSLLTSNNISRIEYFLVTVLILTIVLFSMFQYAGEGLYAETAKTAKTNKQNHFLQIANYMIGWQRHNVTLRKSDRILCHDDLIQSIL